MDFLSEVFLLSWLAEDDAVDALELLVVDDHARVFWVELLRLLKIFNALAVVLQRLVAECPSEVGMSILRALLYHNVKVIYSTLVVFYHLIGLGPLVVVLDLRWNELNRLCKRIDCLLELLHQTIAESYEIVDL